MNGKNLKEIRKQLGLTQTELANLIGRTTMRTVQNWEGDKNTIPDYVEELLNKELSKRNTPYFVNSSESKKNESPFNELPIGDQLSKIYTNQLSIVTKLDKVLGYIETQESLDDKLNKVVDYIDKHLDPLFEYMEINPVESKKEKEKK